MTFDEWWVKAHPQPEEDEDWSRHVWDVSRITAIEEERVKIATEMGNQAIADSMCQKTAMGIVPMEYTLSSAGAILLADWAKRIRDGDYEV